MEPVRKTRTKKEAVATEPRADSSFTSAFSLFSVLVKLIGSKAGAHDCLNNTPTSGFLVTAVTQH